MQQRETRQKYNEQFDAALQMLNENQKKAVDAIYGPVMTIAGPGTGKTQLLAIRIGNIIKKAQVGINNILCLTYTEAGSVAMRQRLLKYIGPEAYNANIFTFHGFCNYVIQENVHQFGNYRSLQPISELELVDVYREIIDDMPVDHILKRFKGHLYYESSRLKNLFDTMKREGWTAQTIEEAVAKVYDYYHEKDETGEYKHPKYLCKAKQTGKKSGRVYTKGEINDDKVNEEIAKYEEVIAASRELVNYQKIMQRIERYDYHDMILWVIDALRTNPDLLADYQERYQFILVDEYQDTNGSQNELLFLLADNPIDDKPNVFIVGDDDQSIFRFQGANMSNIIDFSDKYNPQEIVLDHNYRSDQRILDMASQLIEYNDERLVDRRDYLTKNLIEARADKGGGSAPRILRYSNTSQEELGIIQDILQRHAEGVPYKDMAIIYSKHAHAENLVKYLALNDVPLNIKKKVDVLQTKEALKLLTIIRYICAEMNRSYSGDHMLFEMMHFSYFNLLPIDLANIALYCSRRTDDQDDDRRWRTVINSRVKLTEAGVLQIDDILTLAKVIESWIADIPNVTPQVLFERILTMGKVIDEILSSPDRVWRLQLVNALFNMIKDESTKHQKISMLDLLEIVEKMEENSIALPLNKLILSDDGVNFLTAHGSKGLEFDHVYIIKATNDNWVKKKENRQSYKFPPTLVATAEEGSVEDDRRLFYVAMTRAKNHLTITYSNYTDEEKALEPARFITEITSDDDVTDVSLDESDVLVYRAQLMQYREGTTTLIDHNLIDDVLKSFRMSATSLNKYIRCPITFYYENILRVPMARVAANGFGNAIHYALEMGFLEMEADPSRRVPEVDSFLAFFRKGMRIYHSHFTEKEKQLSLVRGEKLLKDYYETYHQSWLAPRQHIPELSIKTEYKGVPISGNLDRVQIFDDRVEVIDYKTGKYDSSKLKGPTGEDDPGGDYWRQIIFYYILTLGDPRISKPMKRGYMDFVERQKDNNMKNMPFDIADFEVEIVGNQLLAAYEKIKAHQFSEGCGEENCKWCNFVNDNLPISSLLEEQD